MACDSSNTYCVIPFGSLNCILPAAKKIAFAQHLYYLHRNALPCRPRGAYRDQQGCWLSESVKIIRAVT
jgi:hypothetical protein